jgi:hypothetical protein
MNSRSTKTIVGLLIALSAAIYAVQILLFHDWKDTSFYMLQDWAFLPIQIALVTVVVGKIINDREKQERLEKTRILTSSFFSDLGNELLEAFAPQIVNTDVLGQSLQPKNDWTEKDFTDAVAALKQAAPVLECTSEDFIRLKNILETKRMTLLVIASNPSLLEHEAFTDMLWAIFHLNDELSYRTNLAELPPQDLAHLNADADRVLLETCLNWLCHLEFLQKEYPYLYQLEVHRNPFFKEHSAMK